ncbi:MAG TPA: NAD-dependent epimerase/dehydratase family protein [Pirellulales bacterium]|jgi:nucleoside-diphosphate-sugar epimerase|nr:NAD-dependent epimerase/dehydratase family protein [Pirellulales bacterium]
MTKLILGCGYLGLRVARRWLEAGEVVHAVTRSPERAAEFARQGLKPIVADVAEPDMLAGRLPEAETVLYAIGYDSRAGRSREEVQLAGLESVLDALPPRTGRLVYISSTGVYGQMSGEWVNEDSPCLPTREAGRVALAAEELLARHPLGERTFALRLAGIYGPDRIPHRGDLMAGRPISAMLESYLNLIHVDDAAAAVLAAEAHGQPPRMFLVSDGHPVRRSDWFAELARLFAAPPPRFEPPSPEALAASRSGTDKRISNARIASELHFSPRYPSYREGLASIVRELDTIDDS